MIYFIAMDLPYVQYVRIALQIVAYIVTIYKHYGMDGMRCTLHSADAIQNSIAGSYFVSVPVFFSR